MPTNTNELTLCFVAGKSGGHILPCLTLARQWKQNHPDGTIVFFSTKAHLDQTLTNISLITHNYHLALGDVPYRTITSYPIFCYQFVQALYTSIRLLKKHRPARIISTGSAVAIPVVFASYILRIPIELWELNVVPGRTIKLLARLATTIKICFAETQRYLPHNSCIVTAYPIRYDAREKITQAEALKHLNFTDTRITLFILGGSQGSAELNTLIKKLVERNPDLGNAIQCIHQTGNSDKTNWSAWYAQQHIPALVFEYRENLAPLFCATDIVVSRAGAGAVFEINFFEKKCVLIPLQTKQTSHQLDNARAYAKQQPTRTWVCTNDQEASRELVRLIIEHANTRN